MKSPNIINIKKLTAWLEDLRCRYMFTLAAHRSFTTLDRLKIKTYSGSNGAEKNVEILEKYGYYFSPSKEALRYYLIIQMMKFFEPDPKKQSLTIEYFLNYTERNINNLSFVHFKEFHKDRNFVNLNQANFKEITIKEINDFRKRIKYNQDKIDNIKLYRDKHIAHDDLRKSGKKVQIKNRDISVLLNIVKDIIDFYYKRLDWSSNLYENFDKEPVRHVKRLMKDLKNYDVIWKQSIKDKWKLK